MLRTTVIEAIVLVSVYHISHKGALVVCREPQCTKGSVHLNQASAENVLNGNITTHDETIAWLAMKKATNSVSPEFSVRLSYEEMLEKAKLIHPDAEIHIDDITDSWVITIKPKGVAVSYTLPDSYKGTPAWEAYVDFDSSAESELEIFGERFDSRLSISQIASEYNVHYQRQEWVKEQVNEFKIAQGIPVGDEWLYWDVNDVPQVQSWAKLILAHKAELEKQAIKKFPSKLN